MRSGLHFFPPVLAPESQLLGLCIYQVLDTIQSALRASPRVIFTITLGQCFTEDLRHSKVKKHPPTDRPNGAEQGYELRGAGSGAHILDQDDIALQSFGMC